MPNAKKRRIEQFIARFIVLRLSFFEVSSFIIRKVFFIIFVVVVDTIIDNFLVLKILAVILNGEKMTWL